MVLLVFALILSEWLSTRICVVVCMAMLLTTVLDGLWIWLYYKKWGILYQIQNFEITGAMFLTEVTSLGLHHLCNLLIGLNLFQISRLFLVAAN